MKKIIIPHIHKIEGEAGFWAKVTKTGKIEDLKIETLLGLRQIEGILIGRRFFEAPLVVSRICGICPVPHSLAACSALEKALNIRVSENVVLLRKLLLASNIIHSHTLHLFFLSFPDLFNIESDLDLTKRFKKETKAALKVRETALEIAEIVGGRAVHPMTPVVGGFSKLPEKEKLKKLISKISFALERFEDLMKTLKKAEYPSLKRKTRFASLVSAKEYAFYSENKVRIEKEKMTIGDFYSVEIKEDLKHPPVKRVTFKGEPYMVGAIARIKNNQRFLSSLAKKEFEEFKEKQETRDDEFFENIYFNLISQAIEVVHFLEFSQELLKKIIKNPSKDKKIEARMKAGAGLAALEAPRGSLFHYYEVDKEGRISGCNIITPTAQFLANIEEDLKILLPKIMGLSQKNKVRKIRSLIRVYDPCISCATH